MEPAFSDKPIPHLVIDNFFDDFQEISSMAEGLYHLTDLGSHGQYDASPITVRNEFYLYPKMDDPGVAQFVNAMRESLWSREARAIYENSPFPYPMLNSTSYDGMLIGYYGEGGHYKMHKDTCFVTCLIFLHKETKFEGGDFILSNKTEPESEKPFDSVKIESKPNRAVFFPSCYFHGVSSIATPDNDISSMRISYACFMGFDNK